MASHPKLFVSLEKGMHLNLASVKKEYRGKRIVEYLFISVLKYAARIGCEYVFGGMNAPSSIEMVLKLGFKTLYVDYLDEKFFSWAFGVSQDWTSEKPLDGLNSE